jgi:nucleoside-diphosphate-sugar epimerase
VQRIDQHLGHDWRSEFGTRFADSSVFVTGASGFVGGHLVQVLSELGACTTVLGRSAWPHDDAVQHVLVDVRDRNGMVDAVSVARPDLVFHMAGVVNTSTSMDLVARTLDVNLVGSVNVMLALAQTGHGKLIAAGSSEEISHHQRRPSTPYAASKMAMADYSLLFAELYELPLVLARPFMSFGPRQQRHKVIPYTIMELLHDRDPLIKNPDRVCDLIYIADVIRGLLWSALDEAAIGRIIDIGTGEGSRIGTVADSLAEKVGSGAHPQFETVAGQLREPQIAFQSDGDRLEGWTPLWSLDDALHKTVEWYRTHALSLSDEG